MNAAIKEKRRVNIVKREIEHHSIVPALRYHYVAHGELYKSVKRPRLFARMVWRVVRPLITQLEREAKA